ncbi:DUF1616 domain-containing protein [Halobacteriaceae archaeon SHR40]|uniref:DUF1616 domain-containing protein n=1 Tax=Halovenus amylolytica TaxID=2500550 RepID=UPI000FE3AF1E
MGNRSVELLDSDTDTESVVMKLLAGAIVLSVLFIVVFTLLPTGAPNTTEFYLLGEDGIASGYPENVTVGEQSTVQVGIGNLDNNHHTYTLVVRTNETSFVSDTVSVPPDGRWEEPVSVTFDSAGQKRLLFELYEGESTDGEPHRDLQLYVDVQHQ